jgi:hypothetical protein
MDLTRRVSHSQCFTRVVLKIKSSKGLHFLTGATRAVIVYTITEHLSLTPVCSGVRVARSLVFCVMFCRSLFVH